MKKTGFLVLLGLVAATLIYQSLLTSTANSVSPEAAPAPMTAEPIQSLSASSSRNVAGQKVPTDDHRDPTANWSATFQKITHKMAGLDANPEQTDQDISRFAENLLPAQLQELYSLVLRASESGDSKLLATELLARSQLPQTVELLKKIVMSSAMDQTKSPMLQQEFKAFQMLAIEGLTQKPKLKNESLQALTSLTKTISDPLLLDRLHRSLWAIQGKAPSPEQQDREALKKLLEK